jgi:hypothetical protein
MTEKLNCTLTEKLKAFYEIKKDHYLEKASENIGVFEKITPIDYELTNEDEVEEKAKEYFIDDVVYDGLLDEMWDDMRQALEG